MTGLTKPTGAELHDARLLGYEVALRECAEAVERVYVSIPPKYWRARDYVEPLLKELRQKAKNAERGKL